MKTKDKKIEAIRTRLLQRYSVAILHMRKQLDNQRLGMVFGAGVSKSIGFADWNKLIRDIGTDSRVRGEDILNQNQAKTLTTQLLYQKFKKNFLEKMREPGNGQLRGNYEAFGDLEIKKEWKKLVRDVLYRNVSMDIDELEKNDTYIRPLVDLIQKSSVMTVNYNFDDTIEKFLHKYRDKKGTAKNTRGYTVVWDCNVQAEKRENIVYHPNGYLPGKLSESASEQLIFSEDTFEDQLIDSLGGHYNALANHYSSATCLFVGISLEDRTLKHMLRQNSKKCYGHIHYYIHYVADGAVRDTDEFRDYMESFAQANFETYNLYTLFLTDEEIAQLAELITMDNMEFNFLADEAGINVSRQYFLVGSVAVGKSTTTNQLRCLQTFDEWLEDMPDDMEKSPEQVDDENIAAIDEWIADQVYKKNWYLTNLGNEASVNLIDRSPIDALAFTEKDKWIDKAELLLRMINRGKNPSRLQSGTVLFLEGDVQEMYRRSVKKFRECTVEALEKQQEMYRHLMRGIESRNGCVYKINVTNKTIEQVTKEAAQVIFFESYGETDFQGILEVVKEKGWDFYE